MIRFCWRDTLSDDMLVEGRVCIYIIQEDPLLIRTVVRFLRSCHYGQTKFWQTQRQACKYPRQSCESGWLNTRKPELAARLGHLARTPSHPAQSESASDFVGSKVTSGGSKEKAPKVILEPPQGPSPFELRRTAVKLSERLVTLNIHTHKHRSIQLHPSASALFTRDLSI